MSMISSAPSAAQGMVGESWARWVVAALARWWAVRMIRRLEYEAICQLHAMSDRELKDIGITRSQIASAVRGEDQAYRPRPYY